MHVSHEQFLISMNVNSYIKICSVPVILSILMQKLSKSTVQIQGKVKLSFQLSWRQDSLGYLTTLRMTFIIPFYHVQWERSQTRHLKEKKDVHSVLQVTVTLQFKLHACLGLSAACLQNFIGAEWAKLRNYRRSWVLYYSLIERNRTLHG